MTLAVTLRRLYPDEWQPDKLNRLLVSAQAQEALLAGANYSDMAAGWADALGDFGDRAQAVHLYGG